MGVVLIQFILHYSISGARRRVDEEEVKAPVLEEVEEQRRLSELPEETEASDESIPSILLHAISEEEDDDEEESFDGDEPQMFFELLEQTGSEMMMKVSQSGKRKNEAIQTSNII